MLGGGRDGLELIFDGTSCRPCPTTVLPSYGDDDPPGVACPEGLLLVRGGYLNLLGVLIASSSSLRRFLSFRFSSRSRRRAARLSLVQ